MFRLFMTMLIGVASSAASHAQVSYSLGAETPLLDAAFYAGEAADGSDAAGRFVMWGRPSNDGTQVAFVTVNAATFQGALFLVDVGDPTSWRRVTQDRNLLLDPMYWTPDGTAIIWGPYLVNLQTGEETLNVIQGLTPTEPTATRMPTGNWLATKVLDGLPGQTYLLPILADGTEDPGREPVIFLDGSGDGIDPSWLDIAADGTKITFSNWVDIEAGFGADLSDVWVLENLDIIASAPKQPGTDISSAAPVSKSDPNLIPIRTHETVNFAHAMNLSANANLVLYVEDFNNVLNDDDFFNTLFAAEFDIMVSNADGSGSDFRIQEPGNQAVPIPFPGGTRFMFFRDVSGTLSLFASSLEINTAVSGNPVGNPADNVVETTTDQMAEDGSGTIIDIPTATQIDYPDGATQEITITTPIDPVEEAEIPAGVNGVPVVRDFGPDGTTFNPPITVTITYTDAEIAGLDEATLRVFRFNPDSGLYDDEVTSGIVRDLANNTISFPVDHFSKFGLGGVIDTDGDGTPDVDDTDDDNDGVPDGTDAFPLDTDNDGIDNAADSDDDSDGIPDGDDSGPLDTDNDGESNDADTDDDGDGIDDGIDGFLFDTDNDTQRNDIDTDDDNDGISDSTDLAPFDTDNDGQRNDVDPDDDNDGLFDLVENNYGSDPLDGNDTPVLPVDVRLSLVLLGGLVLLVATLRRYSAIKA